MEGIPEGWTLRSAEKIAVLHLFARAFKTTQAILVLFSNGFSQDAQSMLRGLTEGVIDLLYILRKPGQRGRQFARYWKVGQRHWVKQMKRTFPEHEIPPERDELIEQEYRALIAAHPEYSDLTIKWTSVPIEKRAKEVDSKNLYFHYLLACQMLHPDPRSVSSYLRPGEGLDAGPRVPTGKEARTIEIAYVCLLDAFYAANKYFKWRRGDLANEYKERFRREFGDKATPRGTEDPRPEGGGTAHRAGRSVAIDRSTIRPDDGH
jgi:hypothetical protein